ncbi:cytochrome b/b6 domain-containing protein [Xylophilus sp. ASV27]|uniref:cytochrome b/b6 domain-containing protein n=1 Tax=Xylophilus sp. ASV27 TaxID=2795129 RepID=UPI0018EE1533|nr:cytochrome b/b6 domain-containing protein [Xylophilus sp. ASV27]
MPHTIRVWDLPTRLFHWSLATITVALVVTAKLGGNAMEWHLRLGYAMLALLAFRLVWGLVGGRWSRFASFACTPARLRRYLRGEGDGAVDSVGHTPLGALAVCTMLAALLLQVASGLTSDDEIAFAGPLARFVSGDTVGLASWYHKEVGQYLLYVLVALHLLAILFYALIRKRALIGPMLHGDKRLPMPAPSSRDDARSLVGAAAVLAACGALAWWLSNL